MSQHYSSYSCQNYPHQVLAAYDLLKSHMRINLILDAIACFINMVVGMQIFPLSHY